MLIILFQYETILKTFLFKHQDLTWMQGILADNFFICWYYSAMDYKSTSKMDFLQKLMLSSNLDILINETYQHIIGFKLRNLKIKTKFDDLLTKVLLYF